MSVGTWNSKYANQKKTKSEPPKTPGEEIQLDSTGNLQKRKLSSAPYIIIAVDKNSRWLVTKICQNTNHETIIAFIEEYINVYGVPKQIKLDEGGAYISKEYKEFCKTQKSTASTVPPTYILAPSWSNALSNH